MTLAEFIRSLKLQWGRDKNVSEIEYPGELQGRMISFNGAETKMSRKFLATT